MKSLNILLSGAILATLSFCGNQPEKTGEESASVSVGGPENQKVYTLSPLVLKAGRQSGKLWLQWAAETDHAIQISSYNKIVLTDQGQDKSLQLEGTPRADKPDYFQTIEPLLIKTSGKKAQLKGKLLFCNLVSNYCSKKDFDVKLDV